MKTIKILHQHVDEEKRQLRVTSSECVWPVNTVEQREEYAVVVWTFIWCSDWDN